MSKQANLEKEAIAAQIRAEEEIQSNAHNKLNKNAKKRVAAANAQTRELTSKIKDLNEEHLRNRTEAVLELKTNVQSIRAEVAAQAENFQKKQERKKKELEDAKESLLAQGLNPFVEFRKQELAEEAENREKRMRAAVEKNKKDLAAQLVKEQKFLDKQENKRREAMDYEKEHRESLGRHVVEERNRKYIVDRTSAHTEVLDPSGKTARVDPSQITDIADFSFGLGKTSRIPKENMRRITQQIRAELRVDEDDLGEYERLVGRLKKITVSEEDSEKQNDESNRSASVPAASTQVLLDNGVGPVDLDGLEILGNTNGILPGTDKIVTNLNLRGNNALKSTLLLKATEDEGEVAAAAMKIDSVSTPKYATATLSKFERDALDRAKERHADRIENGVPQIAGGKEFQGASFASTPANIVFKDFDVGTTYKQQFLLTNVSYTLNSFKILDLDDGIIDFFVVSFDKPGRMSAGMSCKVEIVFKPQLNHDIFSHIRLLTETGEVSIPLQCLIKRCAPRVLSPTLDFGEMVIGQRAALPVKIVNSQALPTRFSIEALVAAVPAGETDFAAEELVPQEDDAAHKNGTLPALKVDADEEDDGDGELLIGREAATQEAELQLRVDRVLTAALNKKRREQAQPFVCYLSSNKSLTPQYDEDGNLKRDDDVKEVLVQEGVLAGYGSVTLTVRCAPLSVGALEQQFLIKFHQVDESLGSVDEQGAAVTKEQLVSVGVDAAELPIYVEEDVVDLKCVLHERVYRRNLLVKNRGKTACRLQLKVMKRFQRFVDVSPAVFFVQASSSQSVNIKFTPKAEIVRRLAHFSLPSEPFPAAALVKLPIEMEVVNQDLPVFFVVRSLVTSSTVEVSETLLDFGKIYVGQRTTRKITLRNTSMLPQKIAFVRLKKEFQVQPNDGFAVLLPLEEMEFEVSFGPLSAVEYKLDLTVVTSLNDKYVVPIRAHGVDPPLSLSHSVLRLRTTAPGQRVLESVFVTNALSVPQSFEIMPPETCFSWIKISPLAVNLQAGETSRVEIEYCPPHKIDEVKHPSQYFSGLASERGDKSSYFEHWQDDAGWATSKGLHGTVQWTIPTEEGAAAADTHANETEHEETEPAYPDGAAQEDEDGPLFDPLPREEWGVAGTWNFPILVRSKKRVEQEVAGTAPDGMGSTHAVFNKPLPLFLCVETMTTLPQIEADHKALDFGSIAVATRHLRTFKIYNRTHAAIKLKATGFNAMGPFSLLRPIRSIGAMQSRVVIVECFPRVPGLIVEMLEIQTEDESLGGHRLYIPCSVQGLMPVIGLQGLLPPPPVGVEGLAVAHAEQWNVRSGVLDFGHVLVTSAPEHNVTIKKFVIQNKSTFPIDAIISRASFKGLISLRKKEDLVERTASGMPVVAVRPENVKIQPNASAEIEVIFRPDRARFLPFREDFEVAVGSTDERLRVGVIGRAWTRQFTVIPDAPTDEPMINNWLRATAGTTEDILSNHYSEVVRKQSAEAMEDLVVDNGEPLNRPVISLQFSDPFDQHAKPDSYQVIDPSAAPAAGGKNAKGAKDPVPVNLDAAQRRQVKKLRIVTAKAGVEAANLTAGAKGPSTGTFEVVFSEAAKSSGLWSVNVEKGNVAAGKDELIEILCTQSKPRSLGGVSVCSWKSFDATVVLKGGVFPSDEKDELRVPIRLIAFVSI